MTTVTLALFVYFALRMLGIPPAAIILLDIGVLIAVSFWRSDSQVAKQRAVRLRKVDEARNFAVHRAYSEPDVPEWVARVHYKQKRTMGSGNGRVMEDSE